jgi:hypothetical protein
MNIPKTGSASATAGRLGDFIEPVTYPLKVEVAMEPTATSSAQVPPAMLGPADVSGHNLRALAGQCPRHRATFRRPAALFS